MINYEYTFTYAIIMRERGKKTKKELIGVVFL